MHDQAFTATFTKDGYKPADIRVTTHVSGGGLAAGAGNILIGGAIGVGVDAYNGANLDHEPNPVIAHLLPFAPGVPVVPVVREKPKKRKRGGRCKWWRDKSFV